jgi:hypothetical protein
MCEFCGCEGFRRSARAAKANSIPVTLAAIPVKVVEPGAGREHPAPRLTRGIKHSPSQRAPCSS